MDSLKWNAIKFVWICFGLILDTHTLSQSLYHWDLRFTAFYPVCHLVRFVLACGHLLISHRRFFPFDNHFASSTNWISTNAKRKLILNQCQTGCLIKITAKQIDLSLSLHLSFHLIWNEDFSFSAERKWSICCHLNTRKVFAKGISLSHR